MLASMLKQLMDDIPKILSTKQKFLLCVVKVNRANSAMWQSAAVVHSGKFERFCDLQKSYLQQGYDEALKWLYLPLKCCSVTVGTRCMVSNRALIIGRHISSL